jgi:hypothetical protein
MNNDEIKYLLETHEKTTDLPCEPNKIEYVMEFDDADVLVDLSLN